MLSLALSSLLLAGCSVSPSLPVLGAYFPDWLFCGIGGIVLAVLCKALLERVGAGRQTAWPTLVYSSLAVIMSLMIWLLVFRN